MSRKPSPRLSPKQLLMARQFIPAKVAAAGRGSRASPEVGKLAHVAIGNTVRTGIQKRTLTIPVKEAATVARARTRRIGIVQQVEARRQMQIVEVNARRPQRSGSLRGRAILTAICLPTASHRRGNAHRIVIESFCEADW